MYTCFEQKTIGSFELSDPPLVEGLSVVVLEFLELLNVVHELSSYLYYVQSPVFLVYGEEEAIISSTKLRFK